MKKRELTNFINDEVDFSSDYESDNGSVNIRLIIDKINSNY